MSIECRFDVCLIAAMALREKQIQQNYRPIIGVHKWFARRPGTLFRGLLLAEFGQGRLEDLFFRANDFPGLRIADPFMGGGTPLIEANRVGCDVDGFDINPMSAWIVREEIEHVDLAVYEQAARALIDALRAEIDRYYRTSCPRYGDPDVPVKSFLWVKVLDCEACGVSVDLFPGYLLAENRRHAKNVLVCPACGDLNEVDDRNRPGNCTSCASALQRAGPAGRGIASVRIADMTTSILETPAIHLDTACLPSSTTIRTARRSTRDVSSRSPTRRTWPERTEQPGDGSSSRLASCPTSPFRPATRPTDCTAGDMHDIGRCSIRVNSLAWS